MIWVNFNLVYVATSFIHDTDSQSHEQLDLNFRTIKYAQVLYQFHFRIKDRFVRLVQTRKAHVLQAKIKEQHFLELFQTHLFWSIELDRIRVELGLLSPSSTTIIVSLQLLVL